MGFLLQPVGSCHFISKQHPSPLTVLMFHRSVWHSLAGKSAGWASSVSCISWSLELNFSSVFAERLAKLNFVKVWSWMEFVVRSVELSSKTKSSAKGKDKLSMAQLKILLILLLKFLSGFDLCLGSHCHTISTRSKRQKECIEIRQSGHQTQPIRHTCLFQLPSRKLYWKPKEGLCINLEGWDGEGDGREVQKGGDICIPMDDSCWGLTENKIL